MFVAVILTLASSVFADGTYFAEKNLKEAKPKIPAQRAVLKFDGKEQIMLIESTLDGPQGTYSWVIPLPAKPTYLKSVNPVYVSQSFDRANHFFCSI